MEMVKNHAKTRLQAGELAISLNVTLTRSVNIAKIAATCDFDWLFIDTEHSSMDLDLASQICIAALDSGVTPMVRVAGHEHFHASRILDNGAMGIVVPHVNSAEEARRVVDNCKYPPVGHRSIASNIPQFGYAPPPVPEFVKAVNENTLVVVMLETPQAIDNVEAIAAVDGVDALLIGTNDLCAEMGIHGQLDHERVEQAYAAMIAACRRHGRFPGMGGVYGHPLMEKYIGMGARLLLGGGDLGFMMAGAKNRTSFLRSIDLRAKG